MKGISTWMWIIGGIIISFILLTMFFKIFSDLMMEKYKQESKEVFNKMVTNINTLCGMNVGQKTAQTIVLANVVDSIYAFDGTQIVLQNGKTHGEYLCINITGKPLCEKLACPINIMMLSPSEGVLSLVDRLLGRVSYSEFRLKFVKAECGVFVFEADEYVDVDTLCYGRIQTTTPP